MEKLLKVTERPDWNECNLRCDAYEAVNVLVENSAKDMLTTVAQLMNELCGRLRKTMAMPSNSSAEKEERDGLQTYLCGSLLIISQKLGDKIKDVSDTLMELALGVLSQRNSPAQSDAFLLVGAVANSLDADFFRYVTHLMPLLEASVAACPRPVLALPSPRTREHTLLTSPPPRPHRSGSRTTRSTRCVPSPSGSSGTCAAPSRARSSPTATRSSRSCCRT